MCHGELGTGGLGSKLRDDPMVTLPEYPIRRSTTNSRMRRWPPWTKFIQHGDVSLPFCLRRLPRRDGIMHFHVKKLRGQ